jgi:hypothetical protein
MQSLWLCRWPLKAVAWFAGFHVKEYPAQVLLMHSVLDFGALPLKQLDAGSIPVVSTNSSRK